MKIAKRLFFGGSGLLALLVLAGCINPISSLPPNLEPDRGSGSNAADWRSPFTVTLHINTDGSARAAGLTGSTIKDANAHNYVQLVLAQDGNIAAFADTRQTSAAGEGVSLSVTVAPGKTYDILLLAGYWEHTNYAYNEAAPPTLLAAGLTSKAIIAGENSVMIQMNPLVVDTKFTRGAETVEAETTGVRLDPGTWNLEWTISPGDSQTNGFTGLLAAQERVSLSQDINTLFKNKSVIMAGSRRWETRAIGLNGNKVTLDLGGLAAGAAGSYNFNLEYAPFSVNERAGWNGFSAINQKNGVPVWIIRNGVNDQAQDEKTDLSAPAKWSATANGNGAVAFTVFTPLGNPPDNPSAMLPVAGGTSPMGNPNPPSNMEFEGPAHNVTLSSFSMGNYEVTQKEWTLVMGTTIAQQLALYNQDVDLYNHEVDLWNAILENTPKKSHRSHGVLNGDGDNYPMYYISWFEMVDYCNTLSEQEGLTPAYTINKGTNPWTVDCDFSTPGYRLPTEAEWEYAARGGALKEAYLYAGSNNADEVAWYYENSGDSPSKNMKAHPVGGKKPNGLGLYDMSGNVFERCWDKVGENILPYPNGPQTNPTGPSSGDGRIGRGGYWGYSADYARLARRVQGDASSRSNGTGFRVVRTTQP